VDLTPHLGKIVGDLVDRLTLAGITVRSYRIHTSEPAGILIHPDPAPGQPRRTVDDARRILEALGTAPDDITVSAPYGEPPMRQIDVDGPVTLDGHVLTIEQIVPVAEATEENAS
jgi:hypothetical protein